METATAGQGLHVRGVMRTGYDRVLTADAVGFIRSLEGEFGGRRLQLLERRQQRQAQLDQGNLPDFLPETRSIREASWTVNSIPKDLQDRRVEITGPVERKMIINGLNSGARVFMADFEDANSPTWSNCIDGQVNLMDAVNGQIAFTSPEGKEYLLSNDPATLMVRPRGWHLEEKHVLMDGTPISASLFDFGLYFFQNARKLLDHGSGPYFYLPKLENHEEARLWNDVFRFAQDFVGIPCGTIRATVLIENILAAFEMDEILYELREHSAGLNCGRWDYIFSVIRKFRNFPEFVLPDRAEVTMTTDFMRSYSLLCIQTCHRRGVHAMGGMAAQIPIKDDPRANEQALDKVRADKVREVSDGHDGTWVAHPALVPLAMEIFAQHMPTDNQVDKLLPDLDVTRNDLLRIPQGKITMEGVRTNVRVGLRYLEPWLRGIGCVPINHLMEDAATAEISRSQIWQWIHHRVRLIDGESVDEDMVRKVLAEEMALAEREAGNGNRYQDAARLFEDISIRDWVDFLTSSAYDKFD